MTKRILSLGILAAALVIGPLAQAQQIGLPGYLPLAVSTGTVSMATSVADLTFTAAPALNDEFVVTAIAFAIVDNATWTFATFAGGVSAATGIEIHLRRGASTVRVSLTGSNRINTTAEFLALGAEITLMGDQGATGVGNRAARIVIPCDKLFHWRDRNDQLQPGLHLNKATTAAAQDHIDVLIDDNLSGLVSFTGNVIGYYVNEK